MRHTSPIGILIALVLAVRAIVSFVSTQDAEQDRPTQQTQQASQVKQITPNSIRVEPLTDDAEEGWVTLEGYAEIGSPCLSPDNKLVAFDARRLGYGRSPGEIWIARRDGSELRKLVNGSTPRWSPDGSKVLFSRQDAMGKSFVRLIDADGADEKKLCEGSWPEWSPDGSQIAYSQGGKPGGGAKVLSRIYLAGKDGSNAELIAAGDCPSWSPDGKRIACCFRDPAMGAPLIRVIDLASKQERLVGVGWYRANWTSDSKALVANAPLAFQKIGVVKLDALKRAEPVPIATEFPSASSPHDSPDGKYRVFVAKRRD